MKLPYSSDKDVDDAKTEFLAHKPCIISNVLFMSRCMEISLA